MANTSTPATTNTKRDLIDYLWEWADSHGDWGKLLVSLVVTKQAHLTTKERKQVFDYFLQSLKLKEGLEAIKPVKPAYTSTVKNVSLISLSDVTGVNKLAANQVIGFSKNLTVIYGPNGAGKTGYSRILRALGNSYYKADEILGDVDEEDEEVQTATIKYLVDGKENSFKWEGDGTNEDLHSIAVYNNNCVVLSIDNGRDLIVSPVGFHLFNLVTDELNSLNELLEETIDSYDTSLSWVDNMSDNTVQRAFIDGLSASTTIADVDKIAVFAEVDDKTLKAKEKDLKNVNKNLIDSDIKGLKLQIAELNTNIGRIELTERTFTKAKWDEFNGYTVTIGKLEGKAQFGIEEIVVDKGIEFYASPEFTNFLKSAEAYIKKINRKDYPQGKDEVCVYCQQPLDADAQKLLAAYRAVLNDTTQDGFSKVKKLKASIITNCKSIETNILFHHPVFGNDEIDTDKIIQHAEVTEYNAHIKKCVSALVADKIEEGDSFNIDYQKCIKFLTKKRVELERNLGEKNKSLATISETETKLKNEIAELKDKKLLASKIKEIKKVVENLKLVAKLSKNTTSFNSASLSRKTSVARDELIKQDFTEHFEAELRAFNKADIKVELDFSTQKGKSKINQVIKSHYLLNQILCEGEQKAISLAEFLAELQLDNYITPVVFDDPVTSFDHLIIDDFARRLIKLSKERQTVVFTHSILLFNSLLAMSALPINKDKECKFFDTKKEFGKAGYISISEDGKNSIGSVLSKLNAILNNAPKGESESVLAARGYGFLRAVLELFVEHEVLQATIKRYQKNVALSNFVKVNGHLLDQNKEKLNELFERASGFIEGHSNAEVIEHEPTLNGLKADLATFNDIRKVILANKN